MIYSYVEVFESCVMKIPYLSPLLSLLFYCTLLTPFSVELLEAFSYKGNVYHSGTDHKLQACSSGTLAFKWSIYSIVSPA